MAVTTAVMTNQLAAIDQARADVAELTAPTYATVLAELVLHGNFDPDGWVPEVKALVEDLRDAWADRSNAEVGQSTEADELAEVVVRAQAWAVEGRAVFRQAERLGIPGARSGLNVTDTRGALDGFRSGDSQVHRLLRHLDGQGDLTRFGFKPDFLARGHALLAELGTNFDERINHQAAISVQATLLFEKMIKLADYMERLNDARLVAEVRLGRTLPGFDLRLVRAAAAEAREITTAAAPPAATAPVPPGPADPDDNNGL